MFDIHIPVMTVRIDLPSGIYRYHIMMAQYDTGT